MLYLHGNIGHQYYQALYYNSIYKEDLYRYFYTLNSNELRNDKNEKVKQIRNEIEIKHNIALDDNYDRINETGSHIVDDISKLNFDGLNPNNQYYFIQFTIMEGLGILNQYKLKSNHKIFSSGAENTIFDFGYVMRVNYFTGLLQSAFHTNELFNTFTKKYRIDLSIRNFVGKLERMQMFNKLKQLNNNKLKLSVNSFYINKVKFLSNLDNLKNEISFVNKLTESEIECDLLNNSPFATIHNHSTKLLNNTLESDITILFESTTNEQYLADKVRNGYISEKLVDNLLTGKPFINTSLIVNNIIKQNGFDDYSDILGIDYTYIFSDINYINDRLIPHIENILNMNNIEYIELLDKLKYATENNRLKCLELFEKNSILEDIVNNKI